MEGPDIRVADVSEVWKIVRFLEGVEMGVVVDDVDGESVALGGVSWSSPSSSTLSCGRFPLRTRRLKSDKKVGIVGVGENVGEDGELGVGNVGAKLFPARQTVANSDAGSLDLVPISQKRQRVMWESRQKLFCSVSFMLTAYVQQNFLCKSSIARALAVI